MQLVLHFVLKICRHRTSNKTCIACWSFVAEI